MYMGSDAKLIERGSNGLFRANLGVTIATDEINKFSRFYDSFFDELCEEIQCSKTKGVFKSSELRAFFEYDEKSWMKFLIKFAEKISSLDYIKVNVVYSVFDFKKLPEVKFYGADRVPTIIQKPENLINHLSGYFSYLAPWKVCKECKLFNLDIYVDEFSGFETNAWEELRVHNKVIGVPNGDRCNRLISTADILCRFIDSILAQRKDRFDGNAIRNLFSVFKLSNFGDFYIGHLDIKNIVPKNKKNVFLSQVYNKPTIFVLKENIIPKEAEFIYANQPFIEKLSNFATKNNTGFKVIDYNYDSKLISHGDILVYYGPNGEKQGELLQKMGWKVSIKDLSQL